MTVTSANVAGLIALAGLGWTPGVNLFTGGTRDGDGLANLQVAVALYSGEAEETFESTWMRPQAQVMLRGNPDSYGEAESAANALWSYLANTRNVVIPATIGGVAVGPATIQALTPSGTVNPLGKDDRERSLFSMNFTVTPA